MGAPRTTQAVSSGIIGRRLRNSKRRGDTYRRWTRLIRVRFRRNYYQFVSEIAHALRHRLKYRSDGGKFARGLVQHSPDYRDLFLGLQGMNIQDGTFVAIEASLIRRRDPKAANRWVMQIELALAQSVADMEPEDAPASFNPDDIAKQMIDEGLDVAKKIPGEKGNRIEAYLELAEQVGYPKLLDLWYYDPVAVRAFVRESEAKQKEMVRKGGGYPLKGELPGNWQGRPSWRRYPFRFLIQRTYEGMSDEMLKIHLGATDENITASLRAVNQVGASLAGSETALSKTFLEFREHIWTLQRKGRQHLYYQWEKHTSGPKGIRGWL